MIYRRTIYCYMPGVRVCVACSCEMKSSARPSLHSTVLKGASQCHGSKGLMLFSLARQTLIISHLQSHITNINILLHMTFSISANKMCRVVTDVNNCL